MTQNDTRIMRDYSQLAAHAIVINDDCFTASSTELLEVAETIEHYATSTSPLLTDWLDEVAGFMAGANGITWTPSGLSIVRAIAVAIMAEYQYATTWPPLRGVFRLKGDDDLDYNGSYLVAIVDLLEKIQP